MHKIAAIFALVLFAGCSTRECVETKTYCYTTQSVHGSGMSYGFDGNMGIVTSSSTVRQYFDCEDAENYPNPKTENKCEEWAIKESN